MTRLAAFLLCLATSAHAQDRAEWIGLDGTIGSLAVTADGYDYLVTLQNVGTPITWGDTLDVYRLEIDGFTVVVQVWSYRNPEPDRMVVLPPPGWIAVPPSIDVHEMQSGTVRVEPLGLS